ncbi:MAG: glycine betaine ABC transporter substrate-binding protein [Ilumatobacteraceae bacterium]
MFNSSYGRIGACGLVIAALGIAACKSDAKTEQAPLAQTVTIIGLDTSESKVLVDVYARALEGAGFRVARRGEVADLATEYTALKSGAADLMIGHTGELLAYLAETEPAASSTSTTEVPTTTTIESITTVVGTSTTATDTTEATTADSTDGATGSSTDNSTDSSTTIPLEESTTTTISTAGQASAISLNLQANQIGEILPSTLQQGASSNAEDKPVIACNTQSSTGLSLLSDLAKVSDTLRIAGTESFKQGSPFGLPGFEKTYGATFKDFVEVSADNIGDAFAPAVPEDTTSTTTAAPTAASDESTTTTEAPLIETDADCGAFQSSLDPSITTGMVVLDDDKNWIENNGVIPILTATAYTPGVQQIIDQVSQALSTPDLREMVRQVDNGVLPGTVSGQFLTAAGITG